MSNRDEKIWAVAFASGVRELLGFDEDANLVDVFTQLRRVVDLQKEIGIASISDYNTIIENAIMEEREACANIANKWKTDPNAFLDWVEPMRLIATSIEWSILNRQKTRSLLSTCNCLQEYTCGTR